MKKTVGFALVLGVASLTALTARSMAFEIRPLPIDPNPVKAAAAPELDASSSVAAVTFLLGGLAVMRGRRSKALQS